MPFLKWSEGGQRAYVAAFTVLALTALWMNRRRSCAREAGALARAAREETE